MHSSAPGLALIFLLCAAIAFDCRNSVRNLVSARNAFLLTLLAWYGLEASLVPKELDRYSSAQFLIGLIYVGLSAVAFLMGYAAVKGSVFDGLFRGLVKIDSPRVVFSVFMFAICVGFFPLLVIAKGDVLLILRDALVPSSRWSGVFQRGRYGGARDAFLELQMFLRAAIPLAAAVLMDKRQRTFCRAVALAFALFMFVRAVNEGTRSKVVEVFLPMAGALYWRLPTAAKRVALVFGLPSVLLFGLIWSAATVTGRNEGEIDWEEAGSADYVGFEMFRELLFIMAAVPEHSPYLMGETYYVQMVNPIPRAIWAGKPVGDGGLLLAAMQGYQVNGEATMTIAPGIIGEMYWNFGLVGLVLISAGLGVLAKSWDRGRAVVSGSLVAFTVYAAGLALIFVSGRAFNMNLMYGMLSMWVLLIFFSHGRKTRK